MSDLFLKVAVGIVIDADASNKFAAAYDKSTAPREVVTVGDMQRLEDLGYLE